MQVSEHSSDEPKPDKTAKIHTGTESLKAESLMIQKLKMKRAPNIISNIPTCLNHHSFADSGMMNLGCFPTLSS